jgi:hypothetical protein
MLKRWTDAKPRRPFGRDYRLALLFRAQVVDDVHAVHVMVYIYLFLQICSCLHFGLSNRNTPNIRDRF